MHRRGIRVHVALTGEHCHLMDVSISKQEGYDSAIMFERQGNRITLVTENFGIFIRNTTYAEEGKKVYVALTGDQCTLTDIWIRTH